MEAEQPGEKADPASGLKKRAAPLIERTPLPIVEIQGPHHVVAHVNHSFCRLLGKSRKELIGKAFADIIFGGKECVPLLDRIHKTGEAVLARDGDSQSEPAYWLYALWPKLDPNESPAGVIIQLTTSAEFRLNVTELNEHLIVSGLRQHELTDVAEKVNAQLKAEIIEHRETADKLRAARADLSRHAGRLEDIVAERTAKLRETIGELEAFAYSVSHDMRAPLRAMQGFAKILLEVSAPKLDAEEVDLLKRIVTAAERMDSLIRDVLLYTQVLRTNLKLEPVNLQELVRQMVETYPELNEDGVTIQVEGILPVVVGNDASLSQCISNLLTNAVKFVAPGTKPRITIRAQEIGADVRLSVEDNGIGIAAEDQDRIFNMFERAGNSKGYEGTGIGLAIVQKAVERMGGSLGVDSEIGQGSRFWIQLKKG